MAQKPSYGIDAPGVIRNLLLAAVAGIVVGLFAPAALSLGSVQIDIRSFGWTTAALCAAMGLLMLLYAKVGKFRHRDRMLALHAWRGNERVLDVGTGRGLLLVGAARRITPEGHATGIDIWNAEDLSGNALERTQQNLTLEDVAGKCTLVSEAAQEMSFVDESFDVIVSNLCLHNIYDKAARMRACAQIARVLRPGGVAIVSDYKLTGEYARTLRNAGLTVKRDAPNFLTTFPPLRIVTARKA